MIAVHPLPPDRVRISGASREGPSTRALVTWLARRADVVQVRRRRHGNGIDVRYREPVDRRGAFLRSLDDELYLLAREKPKRPLRARIGHALPGRARLRLVGAEGPDIARIAAFLHTISGVARVSSSDATRSILVLFDPQRTTAPTLVDRVNTSTSGDWPPAPAEPRGPPWAKTALATIVLGATAAKVAPLPIVTAAVALTAIDPARRALLALVNGRLTVDVLDVLAIGISLARGQAPTAALITWLLGIGDLLLDRTSDRARSALARLGNFEATFAYRVRGERIERVSARKLKRGDQIVVYAGDRVAADGVIVHGTGSVDEKALTGESKPRARRVGSRVLAASVLLEGELSVSVERAGRDTTAARIVEVLQDAGKKPMTLQREVARIADRVVLPTIALAAAAGLMSSDVTRTTSVLITDFGSGLRIAAPTSALTAMTIAAREGLLIKGGQYLERLSKVDVLVFDKTGTLTLGSPEIFDVTPLGGWSAAESLAYAAAVEVRQRHPVAEAIRRYARPLGEPGLRAHRARYAIGHGVSARVDRHDVTVGARRMVEGMAGLDDPDARAALLRHGAAGASSVLIAIDGRIAAVLGYRDTVRAETAAVLHALAAGGRRELILMSGDSESAVRGVAQRLGLDRAIHGLLPHQKAELIGNLQKRGKIVAMVGDGINDAPALALADVGISLRGSTDVALETADVLLIEGGLAKLPRAFAIADHAMRDVRRGLGIVIAPNAVAIALGALGVINPTVAAVVNNGSTIVAALAGLAPLLAKRTRGRLGKP